MGHIQVTEGYLASKYALSGQLPASQPYYIAPTPLASGLYTASATITGSVPQTPASTKSGIPSPSNTPPPTGAASHTGAATHTASVTPVRPSLFWLFLCGLESDFSTSTLQTDSAPAAPPSPTSKATLGFPTASLHVDIIVGGIGANLMVGYPVILQQMRLDLAGGLSDATNGVRSCAPTN